MALTLRELAAGLPGTTVLGDGRVAIMAVTADSRQAGPGTLFVAVKGTEADGHRYLAAARSAGCAAVACQRECGGETGTQGPVLLADDTRPLPALAARLVTGRPDTRLRTAAVTGTNGKTTVAFLMQALLQNLHGPCGLLGTIHYDDGTSCSTAPLTTPGGPELYTWLGRMRDGGCRAVALEISSHALDQARVAGLELDVAVMTNLGRDHLDYHGDLQQYLAAKARIIEHLRPGTGSLVINAGDPLLAGLKAPEHRVVRFAAGPDIEPGSAVDLRVTAAELDLTGTRLRLDWRGRALELASPLVGRFNVENLAAALAAGLAMDLPADDCLAALSAVGQVPGRLERFDLPAGGLAVVDYAHTHDALAAVLATCDELSDGRLLVVFGCGGDRDRGKRPLMGEVAARGADAAWITSDNPRSEDPAAICAEVLAGFEQATEPRTSESCVILDRRIAIDTALAVAGAGDVVVIAGKGHEDYQLVGDRVLDLDDRRLVREWIEGRDG